MYPEIVQQLNPEITPACNVVFARYDSIDQNVDCKTISRELCWNLLVDFNKHVMWTLDDTFFWLFLWDAVCEAKLIKWNTWD